MSLSKKARNGFAYIFRPPIQRLSNQHQQPTKEEQSQKGDAHYAGE